MEKKKIWETPKLIVHGNVEEITKAIAGPPSKVFGGADGAVWQNQNVTWGGPCGPC